MSEWLGFKVLFSGIFGLVGAIFLAIGIFILRGQRRKLQRCTSRTWGKVTDLIEHRDRDGKRFWHPVFEYTVGDRKYIKESGYGSSPSRFAIGQNVVVYFNPNDFEDYFAEGETAPDLLGKIFTAVGAVLLVIGIAAALLIH